MESVEGLCALRSCVTALMFFQVLIRSIVLAATKKTSLYTGTLRESRIIHVIPRQGIPQADAESDIRHSINNVTSSGIDGRPRPGQSCPTKLCG